MDRFLEKGQYEMYDLISECLVDYATTFLAAKPNYVKLDFTSLPQDENPQEVHRFRREMANSTGNPIVSRSVTIRSHWPDSIPCLQEFGVHIWHLNIHSKMERRAGIDGSHFRLEYARSLSDLLLNVPNLRSLTLHCFPQYVPGQQISDWTEDRPELETYFATNPLPPLTKLESFKSDEITMGLNDWDDDFIVFLNHQFYSAYGSQISKLVHTIHFLLQHPFQNLTQLSMDLCDHQLYSLRQLTSPLKLLKLSIKRGINDDRNLVQDLFQTAEHFGATLESILISLYYQGRDLNWSIMSIQRFHLPHLQRLCWGTNDAREISFDHLEQFPTLRCLDLLLGRNIEIPIQDEIYSSNMWVLLPVLEKLVFWRGLDPRMATVFSRQRYEYLLGRD